MNYQNPHDLFFVNEKIRHMPMIHVRHLSSEIDKYDPFVFSVKKNN